MTARSTDFMVYFTELELQVEVIVQVLPTLELKGACQ